MKHTYLLSITALATVFGLSLGTIQTASGLTWNWRYTGAGINAKRLLKFYLTIADERI